MKESSPAVANNESISPAERLRRPLRTRSGGDHAGFANCLHAGPAALRARREGLSELLQRAEDREEMSNGYRLRFPATEGMLPDIARTVDAERQCCRFLRFSITVEADGGPIVLDLTGPAGAREFVSALFEE